MVRADESPLFYPLLIFTTAFSIFAIVLTYISISNISSEISGYVVSGELNLTVETLIEINFTTRAISWGSGRVNSDATAASLTTSNHTGIANVTGGNWTLTTAGGMFIENLGNRNVTINFSVGKNASEFIGGTNPAYEWNLTALEANSCLNDSASNGGVGGLRIDRYYQANTTPANLFGGLGCVYFSSTNSRDSLRLDFNLTIPENAIAGAIGDVVTATATAI